MLNDTKLLKSQFDNATQVKPSEISLPMKSSSLFLPLNSSWKNDNFIFNETFQDNQEQHDCSECLRLGSMFIDRPIGIALQPLDTMGPVLMKFNVSEQHWILPDS